MKELRAAGDSDAPWSRHADPGDRITDAAETVGVTTPTLLPELVRRALRNSLGFGYLHTTRSETGRLLATLAASRTGTLVDLGTGSGAAAAWLRIGAPAGALWSRPSTTRRWPPRRSRPSRTPTYRS